MQSRTHIVFLSCVISALIVLPASDVCAVEVPASARAEGAIDDGRPRAETRLILDRDAVSAGESFAAGVLFELDDEWHVYGEDPGEAGLPTSITWSGEGLQTGANRWPPTETFVDPSGRITTTGYSERVVITAPITVSSEAAGELTIVAEVDYLACRVKCLPGSARLERTVPIGESEPAAPEVLALFDRFGIDRPVTPSEAEVVVAGTSTEPRAPAMPAPLPLWQALFFALLGGLLLNLMPCVFPVLALKVFGLMSSGGQSRRVALEHSGAYAAGILVSMMILAGSVLAVRWAGAQVGWGFQFQEPGYLVGLTLVVTLFALNLFGMFEVPLLPVPSRANDETTVGRSFLDGTLAVVLATPCSAPFLGAAVGFALAASSVTIVLTFLAVGVGLAAPYVLVTAVPWIGRRLPAPGPWMETVERVLGFVLLGTSIWLVWVFGRLAGVDAVGRLLAAILMASLGAWIWGQLQYGDDRRRLIGALTAIAFVVAGLAIFRPWTGEPRTGTTAAEMIDDVWQPWDRARIAEEQADGRPVFVDFTADWCITCKVNERTVLASDRVRRAFADANVVAMKADWTKRDDEIRAELARFGRGGVPLYLVYPAGGGEPTVLPEILTADIVASALQ